MRYSIWLGTVVFRILVSYENKFFCLKETAYIVKILPQKDALLIKIQWKNFRIEQTGPKSGRSCPDVYTDVIGTTSQKCSQLGYQQLFQKAVGFLKIRELEEMCFLTTWQTSFKEDEGGRGSISARFPPKRTRSSAAVSLCQLKRTTSSSVRCQTKEFTRSALYDLCLWRVLMTSATLVNILPPSRARLRDCEHFFGRQRLRRRGCT